MEAAVAIATVARITIATCDVGNIISSQLCYKVIFFILPSYWVALVAVGRRLLLDFNSCSPFIFYQQKGYQYTRVCKLDTRPWIGVDPFFYILCIRWSNLVSPFTFVGQQRFLAIRTNLLFFYVFFQSSKQKLYHDCNKCFQYAIDCVLIILLV